MSFLIISIALIIILIILGVPIGFSFQFSAWLLKLLGIKAASAITAFQIIDSFILAAVPLFVFMGYLLTQSGTSAKLIDFANAIVGRVAKGALGLVAILGGVFFGACSGSSIAAVASTITVLQPRMTELGYPKKYTTALFGCIGPLGQMIPPSGTLIVFGMITYLSIPALFLGELVPGLIVAFLMGVVNIVTCRKFPIIRPKAEGLGLGANMKMIAGSGYKASWGILLALFIAGGIYSGVFTPSEAAGMGAVYVAVIGFFIYRGLKWKNFLKAGADSGQVVGAVFIILIMNLVLVRIYMMHQIPQALADLILVNIQNKYLVLLILNIALIIIGMLVDDINAAVIAGSLFMPIIQQMGVNPIHFGAILAVNLGMGGLTPPVCNYLYTASRISGLSLHEFFKYVIPFILFAYLPTLFLVTYVPEISLFLPRLVGFIK